MIETHPDRDSAARDENGRVLPDLDDVLERMRVVELPLTTRFRGLDHREAVLLEGPSGWSEFSPFVEYDDAEASVWLTAALEFGWTDAYPGIRDRIPVNATLPAVPAEHVPTVLERFGPCRTVKVKVAERGQTLSEDIARVRATREHLGAAGRIRLDANGGWNVDEAEHAAHELAPFDLEYLEQPCGTVPELAEIRERLRDWDIPVAADESVRKAADPLAVARAGAADILVVKVQPLGGIGAAGRIIADAGLPAVVSSALDTSIGLSMGAHLAASVPELPFDCGLGTAALLAADVTPEPLLPRDGAIEVRRVVPDAALLERYAASAERERWWAERLRRCHGLLHAGATTSAFTWDTSQGERDT